MALVPEGEVIAEVARLTRSPGVDPHFLEAASGCVFAQSRYSWIV